MARPGYQGLSPEQGRLATLPGRNPNIATQNSIFKPLKHLPFFQLVLVSPHFAPGGRTELVSRRVRMCCSDGGSAAELLLQGRRRR